MKASLKFREEQKPLLRAKVPLNILGMPFQSGIVAGDSKELTLSLATFFQSGPSIKFSYRPNDSKNPFSLIVKTGTGHFGSPLSSSMLMSCDFNLLGNGVTGNRNSGNPVFMLHFKPQFGDFSFKKSQSSVFDKKKGFGSIIVGNGNGSDDDDVISVEGVDLPLGKGIGKVPILGGDSSAAGAIAGVFSGMEVAAWTKIPVKQRAAVKFRWGVRVPSEMKTTTAGLSFQNAPFLVMDKIAVEHLADVGGGDSSKVKGKAVAGDLSFPASDVAEACLTAKRQLEVLQAENGLLRNAVENLRREFASGGSDARKSSDFPGKSSDAEASEELKKALMGTISA